MFPVAGIRASSYHTNENADNLLQGKRGVVAPRKALQDKIVNERSPLKPAENKSQKGKELIAAKEIKKSPKSVKNDDLWADFCSYKEVEDENMEDIWPQAERFGVTDIVSILDSYANRCSTPTPEFPEDFEHVDPVFPTIPGSHFDRFEVSFDFSCMEEESIEDVSLPMMSDLSY